MIVVLNSGLEIIRAHGSQAERLKAAGKTF
jgi:hypothetical protein